YGLSLSGLFGVSALYHRPTWSARWRQRLRRMDHAMIFLAIAGTYTAVAALALPPALSAPLLGVVWAGALAGAILQLVRSQAGRWLSVGPYLALGWAALVVVPQLLEQLGGVGL